MYAVRLYWTYGSFGIWSFGFAGFGIFVCASVHGTLIYHYHSERSQSIYYLGEGYKDREYAFGSLVYKNPKYSELSYGHFPREWYSRRSFVAVLVSAVHS